MTRRELLAAYRRWIRAVRESEARAAWDALPWRLRVHLCFSAGWVGALTDAEVLCPPLGRWLYTRARLAQWRSP